jgi:2-keto-3-deoxy-6-phosphogluconate aldolase
LIDIYYCSASFTPNELWNTKLQGALAVKLFPAQTISPAILKDMLSIGKLGTLKIMPSGGISDQTAAAWLEAGAFTVSMGSKLVGNDIRLTHPTPEVLTYPRVLTFLP